MLNLTDATYILLPAQQFPIVHLIRCFPSAAVLLVPYARDTQKFLRSLARSTLEHSAGSCGRDRVFALGTVVAYCNCVKVKSSASVKTTLNGTGMDEHPEKLSLLYLIFNSNQLLTHVNLDLKVSTHQLQQADILDYLNNQLISQA